jgi:hypothetical protein
VDVRLDDGGSALGAVLVPQPDLAVLGQVVPRSTVAFDAKSRNPSAAVAMSGRSAGYATVRVNRFTS